VERFLPLALLGGLAALTAWRAGFQRRRYGTRTMFLFRGGGVRQTLRDAGAMTLVAALAWVALGSVLGKLELAERPIQRWAGFALGVLGVACTLHAQLQLGASWRIGIEEGARPGLVARGWYRWSRNPIFVFVLAVLAGVALLVPGWLTGSALVLAAAGIHGQVRREERWLEGAYGDAYRAYASRVGRYLPVL